MGTATNTEDFIQAYLEGDPASVAEVDDWIQAAARSYFRRLASQWDDVLQDVRLEVFRALGRGEFRGEAQLRTYVWRVVSHSCLDRIRSASRWRWTDVETSSEAQAIGEIRQTGRTVSVETADLVGRVLAEVSEDCRGLWRMIVEGLTYREMSDKLGVSEGALRVRVLRCRRRAAEIRDNLGGSVVSV